ncbi:MAG: S-(hydroxymethyl)glutathione dehydrogenase / alcohol dehydrogenase [Nitrospirae bacterium]|nr:MAG: S-(hydroxymethyl)glutathione dehydrogenase / alcohol dehydrogenase [Nitrospirota bacterium]
MSDFQMKAAFLEKLNLPLIIDQLSIPKLDVGQVLVKVMCSSICGKQIGEIDGKFGEDRFLPHLMGHEGGGVVIETGPGITTVRKGDHVVMHWRTGKGIESSFPKYKRGDAIVGGGLVTTFNDYAVVSENRVTSIPKEVPFEVAALMGCAVTTAFGLINNEAKLKIGQSIAVFGSGGVGLNVIQGAVMVSAYPIIAIDKFDSKLQLSSKFGASHAINSTKVNVKEEILKIVGKSGVDVFVECTGNVDNIACAYELTSQAGRTILVGQPRFDQSLKIDAFGKHYGGKMIFASLGGLTDPAEDIPRYSRLFLEGKLNLTELITHRFSLDETNTALNKMREGETGRVIINME